MGHCFHRLVVLVCGLVSHVHQRRLVKIIKSRVAPYFTPDTILFRVGVVHTAEISNLLPATSYFYRVGDSLGGWSRVWSFSTLPFNAGTSARPLNIIQIGDMGYGNKSDATVAAMIAEVDAGTVDLILHVGDVSYADGDMPHWDIFLLKIESISARVPYMTNPGNHEIWYNFSAYKTQFWTPASAYGDDRMYYSFNYGGVHFVQMNTESPEDTGDMETGNRHQIAWLRHDLAMSSKNSSFVLGTGHRPFYCTCGGTKDKDCITYAATLRKQAETVFLANKVDLILTAHKHGYERTWPVANLVPTASSYINPTAPVYVVNGAGGNRESNNLPNGGQPWSTGLRSGAIGYAKIVIQKGLSNASIAFSFIVSANRSMVDTFTIQKN